MFRSVVAAAAVAAVGTAASASSIELRFLGTGAYQNVRISDSSLGINDYQVGAGEIRFRVISTDLASYDAGDVIITFCTDIGQTVQPTNTNHMFDVVAAAAAPNPGQAMGADRARLLSHLYATSLAGVVDAVSAAGFQLAVWEIVNEAGFDAAAGSFAASGLDVHAGDFRALNQTAARNAANAFLQAAFAGYLDPQARGAAIAAAVSGQYQDQIVLVPIPAAGSLAGAGLLALGLRRRR